MNQPTEPVSARYLPYQYTYFYIIIGFPLSSMTHPRWRTFKFGQGQFEFFRPRSSLAAGRYVIVRTGSEQLPASPLQGVGRSPREEPELYSVKAPNHEIRVHTCTCSVLRIRASVLLEGLALRNDQLGR